MKLPNVLYAVVVDPNNDNSFINADRVEADLIDGDGPVIVGTYKLVSTRKVVKQVVEVEPSRRARRK